MLTTVQERVMYIVAVAQFITGSNILDGHKYDVFMSSGRFHDSAFHILVSTAMIHISAASRYSG
jgi:hypothetical protein